MLSVTETHRLVLMMKGITEDGYILRGNEKTAKVQENNSFKLKQIDIINVCKMEVIRQGRLQRVPVVCERRCLRAV